MYAMYYASMLRYWQLIRIQVRTKHPCLRVDVTKFQTEFELKILEANYF
jgi:hypothetical protein